MMNLLGDFDFVFVYIDVILILQKISKSEEDHMK